MHDWYINLRRILSVTRWCLARAICSAKVTFQSHVPPPRCSRCSMPARDDDSADALVERHSSVNDNAIEEDLEYCRYCAQPASAADLVSPCGCKGSLRFAHQECVQRWISTPKTRTSRACEVCGEDWRGDFDIPRDDVCAPSTESESGSEIVLLRAAYERVRRGVERPLDRHMIDTLGARVRGPWRETPRRTWWRRTFGVTAR
jgi:hypothetical protein